MRIATLENHLDPDQIRKRMISSQTREQFQRWQSIFLSSKGLQADIIAEYIGTTKNTVHQWVYQYNQYGPDGFTLQGRGGRRFGLLSLEEEAEVLDRFRGTAKKALTIDAYEIKEKIEDMICRRVSKDYVYDLLHRHKWKKVVPILLRLRRRKKRGAECSEEKLSKLVAAAE